MIELVYRTCYFSGLSPDLLTTPINNASQSPLTPPPIRVTSSSTQPSPTFTLTLTLHLHPPIAHTLLGMHVHRDRVCIDHTFMWSLFQLTHSCGTFIRILFAQGGVLDSLSVEGVVVVVVRIGTCLGDGYLP